MVEQFIVAGDLPAGGDRPGPALRHHADQAGRASLAGYETPKSVVFAADLPETVGGKVLKYKLRAEHAGHYRNVTEPF